MWSSLSLYQRCGNRFLFCSRAPRAMGKFLINIKMKRRPSWSYKDMKAITCVFVCAYTVCLELVTDRGGYTRYLWWWVYRMYRTWICRSTVLRWFLSTVSWIWQQWAKYVSIFVFWRKPLFWIDYWPWIKPSWSAAHCTCVFFRAAHSSLIKSPWVLIRLTPKVYLLTYDFQELQREQWDGWKVGSDSDVSPLFSRDRWPITAYYRPFPYL